MKPHTHIKRITIAASIIVSIFAAYIWCTTELPAPDHLRAEAARGNTRIVDRHGRLLYQVPKPDEGWQHPLQLHDMSLALQQATIAIEDRQFYHHPGIDIAGIARAAWTNLQQRAIVAGGSTITQQLARAFLLHPDEAHKRTLMRKIRETVLALKMEQAYAKDDILALYLNQAYYGGMRYGVESAARHYFGKPVHELDLAECALLAGLPQAPSDYNPFKNPQAALARQKHVLDAMVAAGYIQPTQAQAAKDEPLQFATTPEPLHAPHFVYYVLDQLEADYGAETIARGGYVITTTLDSNLQEAAQAILSRHIARLSTPHPDTPDHHVRNGAVVVLDADNGAIRAMVGSPNFYNTDIQGQVNAALAPRQPGSAIKPLTYAAALERGWTPATIIVDEPTSFPTRQGRPYIPENYNHTYQGDISLREALATSSNIAAVKVLHTIGIPALLDIATRLGIDSLDEHSGRYGLSLTLGSGEVTLLELTTAYTTFAHHGQAITSYAIGDPPSQSNEHVIAPQIAYLISDILADRYARMHTFGESSVLNIARPAAVKTGTTTNWRDAWTVGYTPNRVVGVWVGNADGRPMQSLSGAEGAGPIWHEVMVAAHYGLPPQPFEPPEGIVEVEICSDNGLMPQSDCTERRLERFVAGTEPHTADMVSERVEGTSQSQPGVAVRHAQDSSQRYSVTAKNSLVPELVPSTSSGNGPMKKESFDESIHQDQPPRVIIPADGAIFSLSPGIPPNRQQIVIRAHTPTQGKLTIFVDDTPLATIHRPPYQALYPLTPGTHHAMVEAQDIHGNTRRSEQVTFTVESSSESSQ